MFNTRADVDRHVQNCMKKVNNETEVSTGLFAIAYYAGQEFNAKIPRISLV